MKKPIYLLTILTLTCFYSYGQDFPDNDAVWSKRSIDMFGSLRIEQYFQTDDTLINDTVYNKLYYSFELWDAYVDTIIYAYYNDYKGALRPVNNQKKVFFIPEDSLNEVLLYDFNLQVGDTVPVWHNNFFRPIFVESIDTIVVNGTSLRRFHMDSKKTTESVYERVIIEGIGSIRDLVILRIIWKDFIGLFVFGTLIVISIIRKIVRA